MLEQAFNLAVENGDHGIDLVAAYPLFVLVGAGLLGLILKMILRQRAGRAVLGVAVLGLLGATVTAWLYMSEDAADWHPLMGLMQIDPLAAMGQMLLFGGGLLLLLVALPRLSLMGERMGDFLVVLMLSIAGLAVMVSSTDFLTLFTGIALVLICNLIMLGMQPHDARGTEAALKMLVTSLAAMALFLFGAALLYGASGDTQFAGMADGLVRRQVEQSGTMALGLALLLAGLGWLVGLAPMHMHVPDLYQGAPPAVAPYIAALPPLAAVIVLIRLLGQPLNAGAAALQPMLVILAALSAVVGSLLAWAQHSPRRAVGYVSMVVVGTLLLPVAVLLLNFELTIGRASMLVMTVAAGASLLLALGVLAGMLGRLKDDPAAAPASETIVTRLIAGGVAFFVMLILLAAAAMLMISAAGGDMVAVLWVFAVAATVAAGRMALIFGAYGLRLPRGLPPERQAVAAVWLLAILIVILLPVVTAYFSQETLARMMYESLRGGL